LISDFSAVEMKEIGSKSGLAVVLSKLSGFSSQKVNLEQYMTDSEIAAAIVWHSYMKGDISGRIIADLGSGTGILGIGALLLGASKVYFVEKDPDAVKIAKENMESIKSEFYVTGEASFINTDISLFNQQVDVILENPPFGVQNEHSDRIFVQKAMHVANKIYTLHKSESKAFIEAMCKDNGFIVEEKIDAQFPLKASLPFHSKRMHRFKVTWFVLSRRK